VNFSETFRAQHGRSTAGIAAGSSRAQQDKGFPMEAAGFVVGNAVYYVLEQAGWNAIEHEERRRLSTRATKHLFERSCDFLDEKSRSALTCTSKLCSECVLSWQFSKYVVDHGGHVPISQPNTQKRPRSTSPTFSDVSREVSNCDVLHKLLTFRTWTNKYEKEIVRVGQPHLKKITKSVEYFADPQLTKYRWRELCRQVDHTVKQIKKPFAASQTSQAVEVGEEAIELEPCGQAESGSPLIAGETWCLLTSTSSLVA
jgi:hypothetical protein